VKRGCDLSILIFNGKIKRSQPRFTRQLLQGRGVFTIRFLEQPEAFYYDPSQKLEGFLQ
jgi:hypothetical protein